MVVAIWKTGTIFLLNLSICLPIILSTWGIPRSLPHRANAIGLNGWHQGVLLHIVYATSPSGNGNIIII